LQTSTHIAPKAIFPVTAWDGDRLVTSYDNNGHYTSWNVMAAPQIEVIPDWVNLSGALNFSREWDRGTGYRHAVSSFGGDLSLMVTHWNTTLMLEYTDQAKRLWGETVTIGERYSTASVTYQWRGLGVSLGMFVPVGRYRQGSESLNRYNTNTSIMRTRSLERQLFVNLSYGINWGHQKQSRDRLIDGGEGVEKSSAAGR
jgi:hypothetical protein